jgi:AcrR family transcriptional regulator
MPRKSHAPDAGGDAAIAAALALAAERGWRSLSLAEIAERAGMALPELVEHFPSKAALLAGYLRGIDARMLSGGFDAGAGARDRLFDVVMRRFEAMAPDRKALAVIVRESGDDPAVLLCGLRRFLRAMALALEAAGLSSSGLRGLVRVQGLAAVYLAALRTFLDDDSPDLSKTMAALDKALGRAEAIACLLRRRPATPCPTGAEPAAGG